jgi:Domain of unknown function (DUF4398)
MCRERLRLASLVAAVLVFAACSDPPTREINQAQGAIDTARAAGADRYAPEPFNAAVTALQRAQDAVNQRDYRLALNHALDARERAREAARAGTDQKARVHAETAQAVENAASALRTAQSRLKGLETSRTPARVVDAFRQALEPANERLQEARTALERQDYDASRAAADATLVQIRSATNALNESVVTRAPRRRSRR